MRIHLLQAAATVVASSATCAAVGLLKNVLAAYYFGTSGEMDVYLLALLVPDTAMHLARTGAFTFIPLFATERRRSEDGAWTAAGHMLTYWLLLLSTALVLAFVFTPQILGLLAPGFGSEKTARVLLFTRALLLMAASVGGARLLSVALHAEKRFAAAAVAEVAFQVTSTLYLVTFHALGIEALVGGQIFGGFVQLLIVCVGLFDRRHRIRLQLDVSSPAVRRVIRLSLPVYLGESGDKVNLIVARALASLLPTGAISGLQYAFTLVESLPSLVSGALSTAAFPFLSQRFADDDPQGARRDLRRALLTTTAIFLPVSAALWLLATPLVVLVFQRGTFDADSTALTASALRLFAPGALPIALCMLLGSAFHARQDTTTPMKVGFARVLCNTVLSVLLAPRLGHLGIALATTVSLYLKLGLFLF